MCGTPHPSNLLNIPHQLEARPHGTCSLPQQDVGTAVDFAKSYRIAFCV